MTDDQIVGFIALGIIGLACLLILIVGSLGNYKGEK